MTEQVAAEATEYVTQKSLDVLLQTLVDRLQEADERNLERVDSLEKTFHAAIREVKVESLTTMQQVMDERFAKEEAKRKSDIDSLTGELREQHKDLSTQIKELSIGFNEMQKGVSKITGLMESLPSQMKARDEKDLEIHKAIHTRIDQQAELARLQDAALKTVQSDMDTLETSQSAMSGEMKRIRATIHGDPENKDDAPSLFKMMGELKEQVNQGFTTTGSRLDLVIAETAKNRADIATINKERADEKARWEQWRSTFKVGVKAFFGNKWVQWVLIALAAFIVVTLFPELRESIAKYLLGEIQGG